MNFFVVSQRLSKGQTSLVRLKFYALHKIYKP